MSIRYNIIKLRQTFDVTQEQLANIAGVSRGAVSQWEGGFSEPRMGAIQRMADHFGIKKSNIIEENGMDEIDPITKKPRRHIPEGAIRINSTGYATVPVVGRIHAGNPQDIEDVDYEANIPQSVLDNHPESYGWIVEGDCMDKVYPEGCLIIIDTAMEPKDGSIGAVLLDGYEMVLRRIHKGANTLILSPESWNPEHEDIVITKDSERTVEYAGTVVFFQARKELE